MSPDEVGYDYLKTLAQSFYGLVFLVVVVVLLFGLMLIAQGMWFVSESLLRRLFAWRKKGASTPLKEEVLDHMRSVFRFFPARLWRWMKAACRQGRAARWLGIRSGSHLGVGPTRSIKHGRPASATAGVCGTRLAAVRRERRRLRGHRRGRAGSSAGCVGR